MIGGRRVGMIVDIIGGILVIVSIIVGLIGGLSGRAGRVGS
jgi:hypothetical protein